MVEAKSSWICPAPRGVILEFPAKVDRLQPTRVRIFDEVNGKQIITITDMAIHINAEGLAMVEVAFLGGETETYDLAGIRVAGRPTMSGTCKACGTEWKMELATDLVRCQCEQALLEVNGA